MKKVKHWRFPSSSGDQTYTVILWDNGSLSCNCKGWTFKKKDCDVRYCKHTFQVMQELRTQAVAVQPATDKVVEEMKQSGGIRSFDFAEM